MLNDTTGTLMSCAYTDQNAFIGLILGELFKVKVQEMYLALSRIPISINGHYFYLGLYDLSCLVCVNVKS